MVQCVSGFMNIVDSFVVQRPVEVPADELLFTGDADGEVVLFVAGVEFKKDLFVAGLGDGGGEEGVDVVVWVGGGVLF